MFDPAHNKIVSHIPPCVHASPFATPTNNTTKGYGNTAKGYGSYDGWLAYTQAHKPAGVDNFLGFFDVPNEPAYDPTVLYLFTALQNVPWIPKVDPIPPVFDIIQPVRSAVLQSSPQTPPPGFAISSRDRLWLEW